MKDELACISSAVVPPLRAKTAAMLSVLMRLQACRNSFRDSNVHSLTNPHLVPSNPELDRSCL